MKQLLLFLFFCLFTGLCAGFTEMPVVIPDQPLPAEETAARDFIKYMSAITGKTFLLQKEKETDTGTPAIYIGRSQYAKANNIDSTQFADQQWKIQYRPGKHLILTGGGPRGILYSVYEFLENIAGCRWFDEHNEYVPKNPTFEPPQLDLTGKPFFRVRQIYDELDIYPTSLVFKVKNKGQGYGDLSLGESSLLGSPGQHHTFHLYSATFPQDQKELFSLNEKGQRVTNSNGQICMTNPEARKLTLAALKQFIEKNRADAHAKNYPPPVIYDISANDNPNPCMCPTCKKLAEQEGSYAAPLLDFINFLAQAIKPQYPEIQIRTFAYLYAINPPKTIVPADNVLIHLAVLGKEFGGLGMRDTMRPLSAPGNEKTLDLLSQWSRISSQLAMWDYWILFGAESDLSAPYVNLDAITQNIPLYKQKHIQDVFVECEHPYNTSFFGLKRYLGYKLLDRPDLSPGTLTTEFMTGMYGPAAEIMQTYLNYLQKRQQAFPGSLGENPPAKRNYLDIDFFDTVFALLEKAEGQTEQPYRCNIQREMIPVLTAFFIRYHQLDFKKSNRQYDFDQLLQRYKTYSMSAAQYYYPQNHPKGRYNRLLLEIDKAIERFKSLRTPQPLPPEFKDKIVIDLPWFHFRAVNNAYLTSDSDSLNGKAIAVGVKSIRKTVNGMTPFGVYDVDNKKTLCAKDIATKNIPTDEKYHPVKIGNATFTNSSPYFFGGGTWEIQCPLDSLYEPTGSSSDNTYSVYVMVKFTGPDYVPNSTKPNEVLISRILFVK